MARMIPAFPRETDEKSNETHLFEVLKNNLDDDFYVVHSLSFLISNNSAYKAQYYNREIDFLIFHKKYGFLIVEAKNTAGIHYRNGEYYYSDNTTKMSHNGPYNQALSAMCAFKNMFFSKKLFDPKTYTSIDEGKIFSYCVWFPQISEEEFSKLRLPPEASLARTITNGLSEPTKSSKEAFQKKIISIMQENCTYTLNDFQFKTILKNFVCPTFDVMISPLKQGEEEFLALQKEQALILNYLSEQKTAAISGVAGSGKTLLAIEKARRSVANGKVLFLCYNKCLQEYLKEMYQEEFKTKKATVDFYTIDGYACHCTKSAVANYYDLAEYLDLQKKNHSFEYKTIIIDEGQDFGRKAIEDACILLQLKELVYEEGKEDSGDFYIFYDKNQMVQADCIASVIKDADCKLTLYRNCRNTFFIARTSLSTYKKTPIMKKNYVKGHNTEMTFANPNNFVSRLDLILSKFMRQDDSSDHFVYKYDDITILTSDALEKSLIWKYVKEDKSAKKEIDKYYYSYKTGRIRVTTSRKFKGLESNAIILIDVNSKHLKPQIEKQVLDDDGENENNVFYVASSRAKFSLTVMFNISDQEVKEYMQSPSNDATFNKKKLISFLGGIGLVGLDGNSEFE